MLPAQRGRFGQHEWGHRTLNTPWALPPLFILKPPLISRMKPREDCVVRFTTLGMNMCREGVLGKDRLLLPWVMTRATFDKGPAIWEPSRQGTRYMRAKFSKEPAKWEPSLERISTIWKPSLAMVPAIWEPSLERVLLHDESQIQQGIRYMMKAKFSKGSATWWEPSLTRDPLHDGSQVRQGIRYMTRAKFGKGPAICEPSLARDPQHEVSQVQQETRCMMRAKFDKGPAAWWWCVYILLRTDTLTHGVYPYLLLDPLKTPPGVDADCFLWPTCYKCVYIYDDGNRRSFQHLTDSFDWPGQNSPVPDNGTVIDLWSIN